MATMTIRIPDDKHSRLKALARYRHVSVNKYSLQHIYAHISVFKYHLYAHKHALLNL